MAKAKEKKMNLKPQEEQIKRLQQRVMELVESLNQTQNDIRNFKASVAVDLNRAFKEIQNK